MIPYKLRAIWRLVREFFATALEIQLTGRKVKTTQNGITWRLEGNRFSGMVASKGEVMKAYQRIELC